MKPDIIAAAMCGDPDAGLKCIQDKYLLPCPFCGGDCEFVSAKGFGYIIICKGCSHYRSPWSDNKGYLIAMHNIRADLRGVKDSSRACVIVGKMEAQDRQMLEQLILNLDGIHYGKQCHFPNEDGTWYSREECRNVTIQEVINQVIAWSREAVWQLEEDDELDDDLDEKPDKIQLLPQWYKKWRSDIFTKGTGE